MTQIWISPRHLHAIHLHATMTYPEECCGILIGHHQKENGVGALVHRILSAQNARQDRRIDRYLIDPRTILAAHREARAMEMDIVGYYHSHPDHSAQPSDFDRQQAWPGVSYMIVSVEQGQVVETRSWRLEGDRLKFDEEEVHHDLPSAPLVTPERDRKVS
ncbi:MAG: M67 family metallopeptidase [Deltaproteobacteria bacterium]|nr:M67 family metallopeptidase [Deltaproteobacteria bacterium]